jgi:hypothetical protein
MANIANVRIGDCDIFLDEVHLGHTKGGVEFTFEREFEDLTVDKYGNMPVNMALTGQNLLIKAFLAEITNDVLNVSIPEGKYALGSTDDKLGLGRDSGYLLRQDAKPLRLHPRSKAATDFSEDVYIWQAVSVENVEMGYKIDEQRVIETTFRALVDETQPDGSRLGQVGPSTIS